MQTLDFRQNIVLENETVLLRPLVDTDYQHLLEFSIHEPEIWQYSLIQASSPEKLKQYIQIAIDARNAENEYPFIVYDKRQGKYAGSTRYYDMQLASKVLQLGYTWYGKDFQGSGLNKHCKFLLLSYAFETMGIERVEFRADSNNTKSIAAMKSIGCVEEGILRSNTIKPDGTRRDSIVLSILKQEWEQAVKEHLTKRLQ